MFYNVGRLGLGEFATSISGAGGGAGAPHLSETSYLSLLCCLAGAHSIFTGVSSSSAAAGQPQHRKPD